MLYSSRGERPILEGDPMRECTTLVLVVFLVVHFAGCKRSDEQTGAAPKAAPPPASAPATQAGTTQAGATKATDTPTSAPAPATGKPAAASAAPLSTAIQPGGAAGAVVRTPSGLEYEVIQQGEGPSPPLGAKVTVHFAGFVDGKKFMDTHEGGAPREFKLDRSRLIDLAQRDRLCAYPAGRPALIALMTILAGLPRSMPKHWSPAGWPEHGTFQRKLQPPGVSANPLTQSGTLQGRT
jgi:hypothetical protein